MIENDSSPPEKRCVACLEIIRPGARVCPKCRSLQKPRPWQSLGAVLKWIGGVTAVISLVIGVKQVSGIVKEWTDRDKAVNQIVAASKMQVELKDYQAAWHLADQALSIAPNSRKAFDQKLDVAMSWLRNVGGQKEQKAYTEFIDPLVLTLARGAGDDDPGRAADVLAHIGWANRWRLAADEKARYEVDGYFLQALKLDPENTYANLFRGYWVLSARNLKNDDGNKLAIAKAHLARAMKTGKNPWYVNTWRLFALSKSHVKGADVEAIKAVNELRKRNESIDPSAKRSVVGVFRDLSSSQLSEGTLLPRLLRELSVQEVKDTYLWLVGKKDINDDALAEEAVFVLALLSEASGDLKAAFDGYVQTLNKANRSGTSLRREGRFALNRVLIESRKKGGARIGIQLPETYENTIVLNKQSGVGVILDILGVYVSKLSDGPAKQGGIKVGDIFLSLDDDFLEDGGEFDIREIASGARPYGNLLLLREHRLIRFRIMAPL